MALQLHRCGEWNHGALPAVFHPPLHKNGRTQKTRLKAHAGEGLSVSLSLELSEDERASGSTVHASLSDGGGKELARNFVAAPRYSSLLRQTRRRHHELRMQTRDRVFLTISGWVFRRVKDPLVEIDPLTVNTAIIKEKEAQAQVAKENAGDPLVTEASSANSKVTSTSTSPSLFGYLPPDFPKGANSAAIAAAIVLLLTVIITAIILALLGKKKKSSGIPVAASKTEMSPHGSVTNGGAREQVEDARPETLKESGDSNTSLSDSESDKAVMRVPVTAGSSSFNSQSTELKPIPNYSTALEQSDLPLPPSLSSSGSTKDKTAPAVGTTNAPLTADGGHGVGHQADEMRSIDKEIGSSNGVMSANSTGETTAAIEGMAATAFLEELTEGAIATQTQSPASEHIAELPLPAEPLAQLPPPPEPLAQLPSASEPPAQLPSAAEPPAQLPSAAESHAQLPSADEPLAQLPPTVETPAELPPADEPPADEPPADESPADEPPAQLPPAVEPLALLPPADEPLALLPEETNGQEYILIGDSQSLSPISQFHPPRAAKAGVPRDTVATGGSMDSNNKTGAHPHPPPPPPSESELVAALSAAAQEGVPIGSIAFQEPESLPSIEELHDGSPAEVVEERRKEYTQVLEKVVPAVSVGAGVAALSSLSGVDGALQVVGVLAATNFLTRDIMWASAREQLLDDIRSIKDHQQLVQFLKDRKIFPDAWNQ